MINHDYECSSCKTIFEASVEPEQREIYCRECHGVAKRVYLRFGTMLGKSKGLYPRFDTQLGCVLDSAQHMEQIAKSRGLYPMGVEEWNRSRNAPQKPHPWDTDETDPQLIEIAKKAWDDVKYDRVPKEVEEEGVMDVIKQSDFLDVTKAPKIESA